MDWASRLDDRSGIETSRRPMNWLHLEELPASELGIVGELMFCCQEQV
jgi:hypothetical protein